MQQWVEKKRTHVWVWELGRRDLRAHAEGVWRNDDRGHTGHCVTLCNLWAGARQLTRNRVTVVTPQECRHKTRRKTLLGNPQDAPLCFDPADVPSCCCRGKRGLDTSRHECRVRHGRQFRHQTAHATRMAPSVLHNKCNGKHGYSRLNKKGALEQKPRDSLLPERREAEGTRGAGVLCVSASARDPSMSM